jgi:hypothetical protein
MIVCHLTELHHAAPMQARNLGFIVSLLEQTKMLHRIFLSNLIFFSQLSSKQLDLSNFPLTIHHSAQLLKQHLEPHSDGRHESVLSAVHFFLSRGRKNRLRAERPGEISSRRIY